MFEWSHTEMWVPKVRCMKSEYFSDGVFFLKSVTKANYKNKTWIWDTSMSSAKYEKLWKIIETESW